MSFLIWAIVAVYVISLAIGLGCWLFAVLNGRFRESLIGRPEEAVVAPTAREAATR